MMKTHSIVSAPSNSFERTMNMDRIQFGTEDGTKENVERIAQFFPEVVTEAANVEGNLEHVIDFDALRDLLGDVAEGQRERYQFTWPGKAAAKAEARKPIWKTMRPEKDRSVDWDTTKNLYIEGDNLDALKLLKETYAGQVKLIYIDPPYNTGHDFIYDDDYRQTHEEYEAESGDYDEDGGRLVANPDSNGRFHSDWCSMMYPRLLLLRDLLSADGLIAVSISDVELYNLGKLMDEIFGVPCRLACAPWRSEPSGGKDKKPLRTGHEYILFYAKSPNAQISRQVIVDGDTNLIDDIGPYRKGRELRKWGATSDRSDRPNMWFGIQAPNGEIVYPYKNDGSEGYWRWGKDNEGMQSILSNPAAAHWELCPFDSGVTVNGQTQRWVPFEKVRTTSHLFGWNTWLDGYGSNSDGTAELKTLFDGKKPFDTPKPIKLLQWIVGLYPSESDELVLDIFSGAAGVADATMRLVAEDGIPRRFIMVQIPEPCGEDSVAYKMGFSRVTDIGEERIRRAGAKIKAGVEEANKQLKLGEEPRPVPDVGFRVLRIDSSNMEDTYRTPGETDQMDLLALADNVKPDRTPEDLLFEVLPKFRIPYSAKIERRELGGRECFLVDGNRLVACFDAEVGTDTIEEMARLEPDYAVMRDASMRDDATEANFEELFKTYSPDTVRRVI